MKFPLSNTKYSPNPCVSAKEYRPLSYTEKTRHFKKFVNKILITCMEGNLCDWISSLLCDIGRGEGGGGKGQLHLCHHSHCLKFPQGYLYKFKAAHMGKEACGDAVAPPQKITEMSQESQYSLKLWTFSAVILCVVQTPKEAVVEKGNIATQELPDPEQGENHKEIWC